MLNSFGDLGRLRALVGGGRGRSRRKRRRAGGKGGFD